MMPHVPSYISDRVRQRLPSGLPVVPGSTPVVAFGDVQKARVATLGLNPSKIEFLDNSGNELAGDQRRLETLASLGVSDLEHASDDLVVRCSTAATRISMPPVPMVQHVGEGAPRDRHVILLTGSACHLDLVQWATDPTWGKLSCCASAGVPRVRPSVPTPAACAGTHQAAVADGKAIVRACVSGSTSISRR